MVTDVTGLMRTYAGWRLKKLAAEDAVRAQERQLRRLLRRAARTEFGRGHGFGALRSVADYQAAVPLRRYEDFWRDFWSPVFPVLENVTWPGLIPLFARSSGTSSGLTKHIPVSAAMRRANRRAALDVLVHHLAARPHSRVLGGKNFFLGGATALEQLAPGVTAGDLSGIAARVPFWARSHYFPTGADAAITDWEEKVAVLAKTSLHEDIRSLSGTPSWLLLFIDELRKASGGERLKDFYPRLEMLVHGGVSFEPYRARFADLLAGSGAETREVYPASEGFIALADRGDGQGLRMLSDNGLFFEFVPVEELDSPAPTRHWLGNAETGVNYALVLTSCAGLWSYVIGDTVRLIDKSPPRLLVTGRISYGLSAFGEHLIGEEIDAAVAAGAAAIAAAVADFMVGPVFNGHGIGHHLYLVEFSAHHSRSEAERFAMEVDRVLMARNADYAEHRRFGMGPPVAQFVSPGAFATWMKSRGKLGAQNKVPRVIADGERFATVVVSISGNGTGGHG